MTEGIGGHGAFAQIIIVGIVLHKGQKSDGPCAYFSAEPVYLDRMTAIVRMDNTEYIVRNLVLHEELVAVHHPFMCRLLFLAQTVSVMEIVGTVDADPHAKTFLRKKTAPVFIEESTVGLNAIPYSLAREPIFPLERCDFSEVIKT